MAKTFKLPSKAELRPFLDDQECYLVAEEIAQHWPQLKADAGFYKPPRKRPGDHAWNIAPDGTIVDATASQFGGELFVGPGDPAYERYISWTRHPLEAMRASFASGWCASCGSPSESKRPPCTHCGYPSADDRARLEAEGATSA